MDYGNGVPEGGSDFLPTKVDLEERPFRLTTGSLFDRNFRMLRKMGTWSLPCFRPIINIFAMLPPALEHFGGLRIRARRIYC